MKLISLKVLPKGRDGWSSDTMYFGEHITQLLGPTSCGKTPIIQSIAFCLGYPCIFRDDIYHRCSNAELLIEINSRHYLITRAYIKGKETDISVREPNGTIQEFYTEGEYSSYLFELTNLKMKQLLTHRGQSTTPYLSTLLPLFYIDQEEGYSKFYSSPSNFIKDQFSEMVRLVFSLPAKHLFDAGKAKRDAKEKLEYLDKQVEEYGRKVQIAKEEQSGIDYSSIEIDRQVERLEGELNTILDSGAIHTDAINALDTVIINIRKRITKLSDEIVDLDIKIQSFDQIVSEINTEIDTLNLNEAARRVFLSFNEICSSNDCKLFSASSESYSKNLLYLKDQIKDLKRNQEIDRIKILQLEQQKEEEVGHLQNTIQERNSTEESSEIESLVKAVSKIKDEIFDLENQKRKTIELELIKEKFVETFNRRNEALAEYESFTSERKSNPNLIKIRNGLRNKFLDWLDILNTQNINKDISFKDDFTPVLGTEMITQLRGSTKVRAVLAFHAALLDLTIERSECLINFFILDAPKQHELPNEELDAYMKKLKNLSNKTNTQVVFSATEYEYFGNDNDNVWEPLYQGEKQKMFLNPKAES